MGLVGTLGSGKTTFAQSLAHSLGVDREDVTSPTFNLLSSYTGQAAGSPRQLHHLDAYRIADEDEFLELGGEELFEASDSWILIEWADRVESVMPVNTLWITIELDDGDAASPETLPPETQSRRITLATESSSLGKCLDLM